MKKIYKRVCSAVWLYANLRHLRHFRSRIREYRDNHAYGQEREQILRATSAWGLAVIKKYKIRLNVSGLEQIPAGPVLFAANHQSYADIPVFCAAVTRKQIGFVAKNTLRRIPVFGRWMREIRSVFIDPHDARSSLKTMTEGAGLLSKGFSLVIFPEARRSRGPSPLEFKPGSLRLALRSGVPIVPVTLNGTYRLYEEKGYPVAGATVDFHVHPAIETKGLSRAEAKGLTEKVRSIIVSKLAEIQGNESIKSCQQ